MNTGLNRSGASRGLGVGWEMPPPHFCLWLFLFLLQITAYNRRTFETARRNLIINIMSAEGMCRTQLVKF